MKQTIALVDERIDKECAAGLMADGFSVFRLPRADGLDLAIASHTDILAFKLNDKIFFSKKYFESKLSDKLSLPLSNIILTEEYQGDSYPKDAIFNGLLMGNRLFCKSDSFSGEILGYADSCGIDIIHVNQGYPACTVLKISEDAAITADRGMEKALLNAGISVLRIEPGGVSLPPYKYGFIGGAGATFGENVYFFGDLNSHPSGKDIASFIKQNGKSAKSLSKNPLSDLGGIIFV